MADRTSIPAQANEPSERKALITAGGLWRMAPDWVPRGGYTDPSPTVLRAVQAGLRRLVGV